MGKCADASNADWWGQFGRNILGCFGIPSDAIKGSKLQNRIDTVNKLKTQLQNVTDVMGLEYIRLESETAQKYFDKTQAYNKYLYDNMNYNDILIKNEVALEQLEIVAIYVLFFIVYLYLLYL